MQEVIKRRKIMSKWKNSKGLTYGEGTDINIEAK